ncbi:hypothetical protein FP736_19275 [Vibrio parahaemolyticus]|nr:hypothetical protein [Vibrio parahaemolyticus]NCN94319.1 hypothetical protein [Vibrio parahaemolyticus]
MRSFGRFRASVLRGLSLVKVGLFFGGDYQRSVAQARKGAKVCLPRLALAHLWTTTCYWFFQISKLRIIFCIDNAYTSGQNLNGLKGV